MPVAGIRRLTGKSTGLHRYGLEYGPEIRKQWQEWYTANKDYFYSPAKPKPSWGRPRVLVDVEAKIAGQTTVAYRKIHPRIKFDEIKAWTPGTGDGEVERLLFLDPAQRAGQWSRYPVARFDSRPAQLADAPLVGRAGRGRRCLRHRDQTLGERRPPGVEGRSREDPRSKRADAGRSNEPLRKWAIERIDLMERFAKELTGKPLTRMTRTSFWLA